MKLRVTNIVLCFMHFLSVTVINKIPSLDILKSIIDKDWLIDLLSTLTKAVNFTFGFIIILLVSLLLLADLSLKCKNKYIRYILYFVSKSLVLFIMFKTLEIELMVIGFWFIAKVSLTMLLAINILNLVITAYGLIKHRNKIKSV